MEQFPPSYRHPRILFPYLKGLPELELQVGRFKTGFLEKLVLSDPVAFSEEGQLPTNKVFKYLYVFSLQNLLLLGLSAKAVNP